jgi:hypothetical protein
VGLLTLKYALTGALLLGALAIIALGPWQAGMAVIGLVTMGYFAPPNTPRYRPGRQPNGELQEADEAVAPPQGL